MKRNFTDKIMFDSTTKTVVSVRDGILEYYGAEIGVQPYNKIFRVYRSPETTHAIASKMVNIPITNGHIELTKVIPTNLKQGHVLDSVAVEMEANKDDVTVKVRNKVNVSDQILKAIKDGKKELSLGYNADLVKTTYKDCDYEQVDIEPHHLAVVSSGRCGNMCSFLDGARKLNRPTFVSFGDTELNEMTIKKAIDNMPMTSFSDAGNKDLNDAKYKTPSYKQTGYETGKTEKGYFSKWRLDNGKTVTGWGVNPSKANRDVDKKFYEGTFDSAPSFSDSDDDMTSFGGKKTKATTKGKPSVHQLSKNLYQAVFSMSDGGEVMGRGATAEKAVADAKKTARAYNDEAPFEDSGFCDVVSYEHQLEGREKSVRMNVDLLKRLKADRKGHKGLNHEYKQNMLEQQIKETEAATKRYVQEVKELRKMIKAGEKAYWYFQTSGSPMITFLQKAHNKAIKSGKNGVQANAIALKEYEKHKKAKRAAAKKEYERDVKKNPEKFMNWGEVMSFEKWYGDESPFQDKKELWHDVEIWESDIQITKNGISRIKEKIAKEDDRVLIRSYTRDLKEKQERLKLGENKLKLAHKEWDAELARRRKAKKKAGDDKLMSMDESPFEDAFGRFGGRPGGLTQFPQRQKRDPNKPRKQRAGEAYVPITVKNKHTGDVSEPDDDFETFYASWKLSNNMTITGHGTTKAKAEAQVKKRFDEIVKEAKRIASKDESPFEDAFPSLPNNSLASKLPEAERKLAKKLSAERNASRKCPKTKDGKHKWNYNASGKKVKCKLCGKERDMYKYEEKVLKLGNTPVYQDEAPSFSFADAGDLELTDNAKKDRLEDAIANSQHYSEKLTNELKKVNVKLAAKSKELEREIDKENAAFRKRVWSDDASTFNDVDVRIQQRRKDQTDAVGKAKGHVSSALSELKKVSSDSDIGKIASELQRVYDKLMSKTKELYNL